jgi:Protein of unknown function (DUF3891)
MMFRSKRRSVIIPQLEHSRLAGTLALLWGNENFEPPRIAQESWLAGITFHDRGYGALDTCAVGAMPEAQWLNLMHSSFSLSQNDAAADLIVKLHVQRLVGTEGSAQRRALASEFAQGITAFVATHNLAHSYFQRLDRITNLIDMIAFEFSFEQPASGQIAIFPDDGDITVPVHYSIDGPTISVQPWPFAVSHYAGFIIGYHAHDYPTRLEPLVIPYHLQQAAEAEHA